MSLLLDALKKAALEKQRREQLGSASLGGASLGSASPSAAAQNKLQAAPAPSLAVNNISQFTDTPAAPFQPSVATAEIVADMHEADIAIANIQMAEESISKVNVEDEPLIFNIDEIDNEYLLAASPATQSTENKYSEVQNAEALETKIQEPYQPTVLETLRKAIPDQTPTQEIQDVALQDFDTVKPRMQIVENLTSSVADIHAPEIDVPEVHVAVTQGPVTQGPLIQTPLTQTSAPQNVAAKDSESSPTVETNLVEQFNPAAGKAALAQLLTRSKKATDFARKRMLIMYALLTLTAFTVLIFYYYLLQSNSTSVVMPAEMAVNNPPAETPVTEVSDAAVSPETPVAAENEIAENHVTLESQLKPSSPPEALPEAVTEKGTLAAAVVQQKQPPSASQPDSQLNARPTAKLQTRPALKQQVLTPVAANNSTRNSEVLPPEFVTKQGVIAYQKSTENVVSDAVARGYDAYQRGDLVSAKAAYREALEQDPHQRDALLGAAAVAVREGRQQDALGFYQQRLARDPKDDYAQAGILALNAGGEQNLQLESELTSLLREYPDASHLHFLQGSLSAARQNWDAAQAAYFEAWQREPKNPDLAFNLAVALDHLNQPKEAARFYQQALTLGSVHPVNFSRDATERRLQELAGNTQQGENSKKESAEEEGVSP
ncbi:MAG: tetratricopeptide repeat protein [Pseudomonadota bacterium]